MNTNIYAAVIGRAWQTKVRATWGTCHAGRFDANVQHGNKHEAGRRTETEGERVD
jgi:hypothetical protein